MKCVILHGMDIMNSRGLQKSKQFIQHGDVSVYDHSINVAMTCVRIARRLHIAVDEAALVRGALLHDYFLYDWHIDSEEHPWHGIHHPRRALKNAEQDFELGKVEKNMILSHMFPLGPCLPKHRESWILYVADKICAILEMLPVRKRVFVSVAYWE